MVKFLTVCHVAVHLNGTCCDCLLSLNYIRLSIHYRPTLFVTEGGRQNDSSTLVFIAYSTT
jgi:hypothetical protein